MNDVNIRRDVDAVNTTSEATRKDSMKDSYHHGNLRAALIDAAAEVVAADGVDGVSMRALAERVGVSRSAAYRHFDGKAALLAAVAEDGFRALTKRLDAAEGPSGPQQALMRFREMGIAYVRFAAAHPARYRLMFGQRRPERIAHPSLDEAAAASFERLADAIEACQAGGLVRGDPPAEALAEVAWAAVHGLSLLLIDDLIATDGPDEIATRVTDTLWQGLHPQAE